MLPSCLCFCHHLVCVFETHCFLFVQMCEYATTACVILPDKDVLTARVKAFLMHQTSPPKKGHGAKKKNFTSGVRKTIFKKTPHHVLRTTKTAPHCYRVSTATKRKKQEKAAPAAAARLFCVMLRLDHYLPTYGLPRYIISARSESEALARPPIMGAVFQSRFKTPVGASNVLRNLISKKTHLVNEFGFEHTDEAKQILLGWGAGKREIASVPTDLRVVL